MNKIEFKLSNLVKKNIYESTLYYGDFEIGGMLIGNQISKNIFEITDITIANEIGKFWFGKFIREPISSIKILKDYFLKKKGYYIGEWHTHPSFELFPSSGDVITCKKILNDEDYGIEFLLLIIAKIENNELKMNGFLFHNELEKTFIQSNLGI